jgi:hypothetical protein
VYAQSHVCTVRVCGAVAFTRVLAHGIDIHCVSCPRLLAQLCVCAKANLFVLPTRSCVIKRCAAATSCVPLRATYEEVLPSQSQLTFDRKHT